MRNLRRNRLLLFAIVIMCWLNYIPASKADDQGTGSAAVQDQASAGTTALQPGFQSVAENEKLVLYYDASNGDLAVKDKTTGYIWSSNPEQPEKDKVAKGFPKVALASQLLVKYIDQGNKNESLVGNSFNAKTGIKTVKIPNGIQCTYTFPSQGFSIPVQYTITGATFQASIVNSGIVDGEKMKVSELSVLPFFGAGSPQDNGYMLVPDGSGALIRFNNGKANAKPYSLPVYGRDLSLKLNTYQYGSQEIKMPVFGIKNGFHAVLAVIEDGASVSKVNAAVSGQDTEYNHVYPTFQYRQNYIANTVKNNTSINDYKIMSERNTKQPAYRVRYLFLPSDQASYSGMAKAYQAYLVENAGLKKTVKHDNYPLYVETYGGVSKLAHFLGIPYQTEVPLTTYAQAEDMLKALRQAGIGDITFKYVGWMKNGIRDKMPTGVSYEGKLGGASAFRDLAAYARDNGVHLFPSVDLIDLYKSGNGLWTFSDAAQKIDHTPAFQYDFFLNSLEYHWATRWYLLRPEQVPALANKFAESYQNLHIAGLSLDAIGSKIYSDYSKKGIDRSDVTGVWENTLNQLSKDVGSLMVDNANAYAFPYVHYIMDAPVVSNQNDVVDESVPFYQTVLHGYVSYSVPFVNESSDPQEMVLKAAETGSSLAYAWIGDSDTTVLWDTPLDKHYSADYRGWLGTVASDYKRLQAALSGLTDTAIVDHETIRPGVTVTTYDNGVKIAVNYNDKSETVGGRTIGPRDFTVMEG